jgi:hypothetical protein
MRTKSTFLKLPGIALLAALLTALLSGLLAACTPGLQPPEPEQAVDLPEAYYRQAQAAGLTVLKIDPARSLLTIEVRRAGALARLGHDHVVASHALHGYVAPQRGRADLALRLEQLTVDEPALRAQAGFDTQPSDDAIAGTRRNMLDKVLEVQRFPQAAIRVDRIGESAVLRVTISLHGATREFDVPARIEALPGGGMAVSGRLQLKQTDFGITPYSVLGGALAVQDRLDLGFQVVAGP